MKRVGDILGPLGLVEREVGDRDFPLEAGRVNRRHPLVGSAVVVADHAQEVLRSHRGHKAEITGVVEKYGQVAGFEVGMHGKRFTGPKKDFYLDSVLEDLHVHTPLAVQTRQVLDHWDGQHDYYGPSWDGVELLCYSLAKVAREAAIESPGWYRYPSSTQSEMDGKDWRYLLPDQHDKATVVNCHSLLHDSVWTLTTTVFSTSAVNWDKAPRTGAKDHWERALKWTLKTAEALARDGYRYQKVRKALQGRINASRRLRTLRDTEMRRVQRAVNKTLGKRQLAPVSVGYSSVCVEPGHVGRYEPPTDVIPYGILTVHPSRMGDREFSSVVLRHELVHHAVTLFTDDDEEHGKMFHLLAKAAGLPKRYRK